MTQPPEFVTPEVDPGPKSELRWIPLESLMVDHRYQRELGRSNWTHINKIAKNWRWGLCQPLAVCAIEGGLFSIVDGQHRFEAAKKHPAVDQLPCFVIHADNLADQARAFEALNSARIGVTRLQRFWAALAAGDAMAIRIKALCERSGVKIARKAQRDLPARTLSCTHTLEKLTPLGDVAITTALKLIVEAQGDVRDVFRASIVAALASIVEEEGEEFDRASWLVALRPLDFFDTEAASRAARAKQGGALEEHVKQRLHRALDRVPGRKAAA